VGRCPGNINTRFKPGDRKKWLRKDEYQWAKGTTKKHEKYENGTS